MTFARQLRRASLGSNWSDIKHLRIEDEAILKSR